MEVLATMMEQNLLVSEKQGRHTLYGITEKGKNVLNYFNGAMELIEVK
jgi:predicted transcriptional regulator